MFDTYIKWEHNGIEFGFHKAKKHKSIEDGKKWAQQELRAAQASKTYLVIRDPKGRVVYTVNRASIL